MRRFDRVPGPNEVIPPELGYLPCPLLVVFDLGWVCDLALSDQLALVAQPGPQGEKSGSKNVKGGTKLEGAQGG
jgi:hypothetical protein